MEMNKVYFIDKYMQYQLEFSLVKVMALLLAGVYTKFSGRLSEELFPSLIQKFPCILISRTGQPGCQLNLSEGQN